MKFFHTYKNWFGGWTTFEWSGEEQMNFELFILIIICVIGSIFASIASAIVILLRILSIEDDDSYKFNILGIVMSGVFLLDMHYHFIMYIVLTALTGGETVNTLFNLNVAYLAVHLALLFIPSATQMGALVKSLLVFIVVFLYCGTHYKYVAPPIKIETQEEREERISNGDFKNEQERKEHFDKLERMYGN
jgi:hypothetical protein